MFIGKYQDFNVAIKQIKDSSEDNVKQALREIDILKSVCGINVVKFYGAVVTEEKILQVTELMDLGSLEKLLKKEKLNMEMKIKIMQEVAVGMESIHNENIIHRDLKPDNVLCKSPLSLDNEELCKITDFGTSRAVDVLHAMTMTKGQGTPLYMAPEVLAGTEHYSKSVDVYSYGILMWSVLSDGAMPYSEYTFKNALMLQNAIVEGTRPQINEEWPPDLVELMKVCWSKDASDRPTFNRMQYLS